MKEEDSNMTTVLVYRMIGNERYKAEMREMDRQKVDLLVQHKEAVILSDKGRIMSILMLD